MSSFFARHPEQDLVRYLDGELSAGKIARVASHLESCGSCRAELEELKATLADCAQYRSEVRAQSPEAPLPWRDLYRDFSRIDESLASDSLLVRLMRPLVHAGALRWSCVTGLAALIVLMSLHQLRQAPSVQAATLLRKAVEVSQSKPRPVHRVRVRTSHQQEFTRSAVAQAPLLDVAEAPAVAALFQAAHFDWIDPLSARAFEQWRNQQVQKTDEVSTVANPQAPSASLTQVRTVAAEGELAAATLTLDAADYPVEERLEFRDQEWVELSEIAETSTDSAGTVASHVEVPVRAAEPPSRSAAFTPGSSASISDEIQVLSALSGVGADLGEQVEVALSDGKVKVTGESITPRRQEVIREAVARLPHVELEFTQPHGAALPAEAAVATSTGGAVTESPIQARLQKQLGGHAQFERFSSQVLESDDKAMQYVYALHNLALKISAADEAQLDSKDKNVLHELSRKQTVALSTLVGEMERTLTPTLSSMGGAAATVHPVAHANWQAAANDVQRDAKRVEVLLAQMLGVTPDNSVSNALPVELLGALKQLHANLDDCQSFLR